MIKRNPPSAVFMFPQLLDGFFLPIAFALVSPLALFSLAPRSAGKENPFALAATLYYFTLRVFLAVFLGP